MSNHLSFIILIAVTLIGLLKIWQKHLSSTFQADTITVLIQYVSVLFLLPLFLFIDFDLKLQVSDLVLVFLAGLTWYFGSLVANRSIQQADLTLREPLVQTRTVFVIIFSMLLLGEKPTSQQLVGSALITFGAIVSAYRKKLNFRDLQTEGALLCLLSSLLIGISYTIDKYGLRFIDYVTWSFLMFLIPSILVIPKAKSAFAELKKQTKKKISALFCLIILNSIAYMMLIYVFSKVDLSLAYPLSQLSSIIVFLGGIYLGERTNLTNRCLGAVLTILGGLLLYMQTK